MVYLMCIQPQKIAEAFCNRKVSHGTYLPGNPTLYNERDKYQLIYRTFIARTITLRPLAGTGIRYIYEDILLWL